MEKERTGDLKRNGGTTAAAAPPVKRQQRVNSKRPPSSPPSLSVLNNGSCDSESGDEEAGEFRATTISRKRVSLHGKELDDRNALGLAIVPRRVRSAMSKRNGQSASSPLSDSKRKQHRVSNRAPSSLVNGAKRLKINMLSDSFTKDEEEVAETLASLVSLVDSRNIRVSEEIRRTKKASVSLSEASKEGATRFLLPCSGTEETKPSSCVEQPTEETIKKDEACANEQPLAISGSLKCDLSANGTDLQRPPTSSRELAKDAYQRDAIKSSYPFGSSYLPYFRIGEFQQSGYDGTPPREREFRSGNCYSQIESVSREQESQTVKQNLDGSGLSVYCQETTPDVQSSSNGQQGHSTMCSSSKATVQHCSISHDCRPSSTGDNLPIKHTADMKSRKRCMAHVYISHLIKDHQKRIKSGVETPHDEPLGSRNGRTSTTTSADDGGSAVDKNIHEDKEGALQEPQQAPTLSGSFARQKQIQVSDFLSLSASDETNKSTPGQHHVPYLLHSQAPFSQGPYISPYPDQLASATTHQVPMQLLHYMGGGPFYVQQHMGGTLTKQQQQQQQMWQAHVAPHYKWPRQQVDTSASSLHPEIYHLSKNLQQLPPAIPSPPPSSSSRARKQQQHHDGSSQAPGQLQLLCHAQNL